MTRNLNEMTEIQEQKLKDLENKDLKTLDKEGTAMAEHKRYTLDIVDTPTDPLR